MVQVWSHPFPKTSVSPGDGKIVAKLLPGGGNGLETIVYQYPLKLISPTSATGGQKSVLVFLLSYGGGLVAGDSVNLGIEIRAGASLSIVTQGHTKVFKSPSPEVVTTQNMTVNMEQDSALCLLPDPVQPFEDSVYTQTQIFKLASRCSLCLLDWVTAGRTARGENWSFVNWKGRNEVWLTGADQPRDRLLVRDSVILSRDGSTTIGLPLRDTMHKMSVFGTLILRGTMLEPVGKFFLAEFDALPRLGARDFRPKETREEEAKNMSNFELWRSRRIEREKSQGVLWSAAHVRGCVIVKFGAPDVEAGKEWLGSMLIKEGTVDARFGEDALIVTVSRRGDSGKLGRGRRSEHSNASRDDQGDARPFCGPEEQKATERAAAERRAQGRSRFRSKRSRGDAMGSRGGRGISSASGPFGGGIGGSSGRAGGWFGGGAAGSGPGGSFHGGAGRGAKSEGKGFAEADGSRMREARINADKLHVMSPEEELDSEDEAMMAALSGRAPSAMPMGIYRREHKDTGIVVATTAELEAAENATGEEESLWVDGDGSVPLAPQPEEDGVWDPKLEGKVAIKKEPDAEDAMEIDAPIASPTLEKKPVLVAKPKKDVPQDPEDKTIQADMNLLASELGAVTVTGEDGEAKSEGPANKDGRMYLFQFPPLISPLKQVAAPRPKIKEEGATFNMADAPAAPVDLTQDDSRHATAGADDDDDDDDDEDEDETGGFRSQMLAQGGMIGRLNVRKSGKVELDWGGTTLEMSPAAGMNFLTTAVIVEENDEKPQHGVVGGDSIGMGKIMGRFVLSPMWNDEEEWNVADEELVVDGGGES
ncbi:urease accessory protein UreD [Purpureocillium lavendulum]|uniref:Urease accessory protein UreD n=1 Tax=Purpureocillium lavendulum TaxID=1247861 RepID=A0AB34FI53_9HYPO|nr:urease accessory protein UreD [Purpureocillium lavendulum]